MIIVLSCRASHLQMETLIDKSAKRTNAFSLSKGKGEQA